MMDFLNHGDLGEFDTPSHSLTDPGINALSSSWFENTTQNCQFGGIQAPLSALQLFKMC